MSARASLPAALLSLGLLAPPAHAAWPHDPTVNVPVSVTGFNKTNLIACSDGAGGMIMAWVDARSGVDRIYAQRLLVDGTVAPGWTANGVELVTGSTVRNQEAPAICSDGAGGAFVAWTEVYSAFDHDINAQHVAANGSLPWGTFGLGVVTLGELQDLATVAPDALGGFYVAWQDHRSGTNDDIYAQHLTAGGALVAGWTSQGVPVCTAVSDQTGPQMAADGAGGCDVVWLDLRGPSTHALYAQRFTAGGGAAPAWSPNGNALTAGNYNIDEYKVITNNQGGGLYVWTDERYSDADPDVFATGMSANGLVLGNGNGSLVLQVVGTQFGLTLAPDGEGGAFAAWSDQRLAGGIYAQHVDASGFIVYGWPGPFAGLAVNSLDTGQFFPVAVSDGVGGALITWMDDRSPRADIYASHVTSTGAYAEGWDGLNGNPVSTSQMNQAQPVAVSDGASGAIVAWLDDRNSNLTGYSDIYAQRIERFGQLGDPGPAIQKVADVLGDQGGHVQVQWTASYLDAYPGYGVSAYWLWRQVPAAAAQAALQQGAQLIAAGGTPAARPGGTYRTATTAGLITYWEYVTSLVANGFPGYSVVTATLGDSVAGSNPLTTFMVEARGAGSEHWDSAPASGYSVDNLAPATPAPFTGAYVAGATHLHWGADHEGDLAGYALYRGADPAFTPGPSNQIAAGLDTSFVDAGGAGSYYKLSAVDVHGNQSPFALLGPGTTLAVGDRPVELSLSGAAPNPVRGATTIAWALPRAASVRLEILDTAGRRVRTLAAGDQPAGRHATPWDARDAAGRPVGSGIYFVRLTAGGRTLESRLAAIR